MMRIRLIAAALATAGVLAGASGIAATPARADVGDILGDIAKVGGYVEQVNHYYDLFNQYALLHKPVDLEAIRAAILQSQQEIVSEIDAIAAAQVQACSATAVQQFANVDRMSPDTLQAFAAASVACVNAAAADIAAESDRAAIDKTGFALNIVGPIALFASADANERTDILKQSLIAANQLLIKQLKPTCELSVLNPDDVPSIGDGGVTMHGVCFNYHVKAPSLVNGHVFYLPGPTPNVAFDPWYVRGLAKPIDKVFPNRGYDIFFWPCSPTPGCATQASDIDYSIPSNAVLAATSAPIADAALLELQPAIGRWGSPIAVGATTPPGGLIEALRVNGGGSVARNEIRDDDPTFSGWTPMDGRLRSLAVETNADGRLEMFGTDRIGRVFHRWQEEAGDDTSWSPWALLTGQVISSLAATHNPDGTLQLFGTDPAGQVFTRQQILGADQLNGVRTHPPTPAVNAWTDWTQLDGTLTQIAAAANVDGQVELFGVNDAGQLYDRRETTDGGWTPWNQLDGTFKSVAVTPQPGGSLNLFGTDTNGVIWTRHQKFPTTEAWSPWTSLGGPRASNIAATTERLGQGRVNLLAQDTNGRIWLTSADLHGDMWRAWTPVPDTPAMLPTVPSPGPQQTALGAQADLVLSATGGTAPYTLEITGLPPGLTASSGQITGTPSAAGTFTVSVTPTDTVATPGATTTFTWTITGVTVPNIVGDALPAAQGALGSVGLILGTETDRGTTNCDLGGSIGSQNPAAGSIVSKGSSIAFTKWVLPPRSQCQ